MSSAALWESVPGWTCPQQLRLYSEVCELVVSGPRVPHYVEVGVAYGRGLAYLLGALKRPSIVTGIDLWAEHMGGDNLDPKIYAWLKTLGSPQEAARTCLKTALSPFTWRIDCMALWQGSSVERSKQILAGELDFVFIDAEHTYEAVKADIEAWLPKMRPGSILAGHDINAHFPGVEEAVRDLLPVHEARHNMDGWGGVWIYRVK